MEEQLTEKELKKASESFERKYFREQDLEYMQMIKDNIEYFKTKIQKHTYNPRMRDLMKEMVILCKTELIKREQEYRDDYGSDPIYSR